MRHHRMCVVWVCVLLLGFSSWGPGSAALGQGAEVEAVLDHIPAGSLGFIVVNNVKATTDKVDKFLVEIGVSEMLPSPDPDNPSKKPPVLGMLKAMAQVGEGFNDNGGLAVVMLDPKAYGLDLLKMLNLGGGMTKAAAAPAAEPKPEPQPKVPFVILVPGTGIKEIFGAYKQEPAGKHTLLHLRMGPTYAAKVGGYVALSPNDKALAAVVSAKAKAPGEIPPEQLRTLRKADLGYHVNMRVAGPVADEFMKKIGQQMVTQAGPMGPVMGTYIEFYRDMIGQLETVSVGARLVPGGLVFDEMVAFKDGSTFDKALAAGKGIRGGRLDALPDLKYAMAVGSAGQNDPTTVKLTMDMIDGLIKSELLKQLPEAERQRLRKVARGLTEQITDIQMVIGGTPEGSGLFGMAFVMKCKDAAKTKQLLAEEAKSIQAIARSFAEQEPDMKDIQVRYVKGLETIGSVSVDAIVVEHPELTNMEEDDRAQMKKALGEDNVRFYLCSPDSKTVVATFGGARPFLVEALKASRGGGKIGTMPADLEAVKHLPKNRSSIVLINVANLFDVVVNAVRTMDPDEELPPFKLTCKTPIAAGVGVTGDSAHIVLYVPSKLIKEVVGVVTMFVMPQPAPGPGEGKVAPNDL